MPEQPESLQPTLKKKCPDCPPLVVPRRGYTPTRPSCIDCVEKHLGAALVLLTETREGYAYRLRAIGHLFEAEGIKPPVLSQASLAACLHADQDQQ